MCVRSLIRPQICRIQIMRDVLRRNLVSRFTRFTRKPRIKVYTHHEKLCNSHYFSFGDTICYFKRKSYLRLWKITSSIEVITQNEVIIVINDVYVYDAKTVTPCENRY